MYGVRIFRTCIYVYIYTYLYRSPLWYHYPHDAKTFAMDDGYLLGKDILVNPVYEQGATSKTIYFPGNDVYTFSRIHTHTCAVYSVCYARKYIGKVLQYNVFISIFVDCVSAKFRYKCNIFRYDLEPYGFI